MTLPACNSWNAL